MNEVTAIPWTEEGAGSDDKRLGVGVSNLQLGFRLTGSIDADWADRITFPIGAPEASIEDPVRRERDERQAEMSARPGNHGGSRRICPNAEGLLAMRIIDPHVSGRVHHSPGPVKSKRCLDRGGIGDVQLAAGQRYEVEPALRAEAGKGSAQGSSRPRDEQRPAWGLADGGPARWVIEAIVTPPPALLVEHRMRERAGPRQRLGRGSDQGPAGPRAAHIERTWLVEAGLVCQKRVPVHGPEQGPDRHGADVLARGLEFFSGGPPLH